MEKKTENKITKHEAIKELCGLMWGISVIKHDNHGKPSKYAYYTIGELIPLIQERLEGKSFFYREGLFKLDVYHEELEDPIITVELPKEWYDGTVAGNVSIMSPEQRVQSQITMARKALFVAAFNVNTPDDVDHDIQSAQEAQQTADKEQMKRQKQEQLFEAMKVRMTKDNDNITKENDTINRKHIMSADITDEQEATLMDMYEKAVKERTEAGTYEVK